jgi:hypothetical protein
MSDIDKLYEEIKKEKEEELQEKLNVSPEESEPSVQLRKKTCFLLEAAYLASLDTKDILLKSVLEETITILWNWLPEDVKAATMKERTLGGVPASSINPLDCWKSSFPNQSVANNIWDYLNKDEELEDIQKSIDEATQNLESRIEALELAMLNLAEKLKPLILPEGTK